MLSRPKKREQHNTLYYKGKKGKKEERSSGPTFWLGPEGRRRPSSTFLKGEGREEEGEAHSFQERRRKKKSQTSIAFKDRGKGGREREGKRSCIQYSQ